MIEDAASWLAEPAESDRPTAASGSWASASPAACRSSPPAARRCATGWRSCCRSAATATCRGRCTTSAPARSLTAPSRAARLRRGDHPARRRRSSRPGGPGAAAAAAILAFLEASRLDMVDKARAASGIRARPDDGGRSAGTVAHADDLRQQSGRRAPRPDPRCPISPPSAATPRCHPIAAQPPACPIYLLHGLDDNVIPAVESRLLARTLRDRGVDGPLPRHAARHPRRGRSRRVGLVGVRAGPLLDRGPRGLTGPRPRARRRLRRRAARRRGRDLAQRRDFLRRELPEVTRPQPLVGDRPDRHAPQARRPDGRSTRTSCAPGDCALRGSRSTAASRRVRWATR